MSAMTVRSADRSNHFDRILPVVGDSLFTKRVAVAGLPQAAEVVRYLAANGVGRWVLLGGLRHLCESLHEGLLAQHGEALPLEMTDSALAPGRVDLFIAVGKSHWDRAADTAATINATLMAVTALEGWEWTCSAPLVARNARRILTGQPASPLPVPASAGFVSPQSRRGALFVIGLGSLGSVAATTIAPYVGRFVLADPDIVDLYNPVRQAYTRRMVGRPKALALAETLRAGGREVVALPRAITSEEEVRTLVETHGVDAALVVTGTEADFAIARALRAAGIPHVVGRCYPRAHFWEAMAVTEETDSYEEMRGHVLTGASASPTAEQRRAYSTGGTLEAEPATLIESGWAAAWMARLVRQLMLPPSLRELWFLEDLSAHRSCFLGGIEPQSTPFGPAYGIEHPGQVRAYARRSLAS